MVRIVGASVAVLVIGSGSLIRAEEPPCSPTRISVDEARALVEAVPDIVAVREPGEELFVDAEEPDRGRNDEIFFFSVWTSMREKTLLDNGLVGYFNVNQQTAQVNDSVLIEEIHGKELEELQEKLRRKHCIDRALVDAHREIPAQ
jgi:hypothetical protein